MLFYHLYIFLRSIVEVGGEFGHERDSRDGHEPSVEVGQICVKPAEQVSGTERDTLEVSMI